MLISAVAKVVANEASVQPISAWPCIRDWNLPPNRHPGLEFAPQIVFTEKDYDALSSVIHNLYGSTLAN